MSEYVAMVLGTVMTALPVAVPTVILGANAACTAQLKQRGIDVLMVAKLKTIAAVEVVCFDKTGTLTGSVVSTLFSSKSGNMSLPLYHGHHQMLPGRAAGLPLGTSRQTPTVSMLVIEATSRPSTASVVVCDCLLTCDCRLSCMAWCQ